MRPILTSSLLAAVLVVMTNVPSVAADPVTDKRAQADAIAAKIDALNSEIEHYAEAANGAQVELDALNAEATTAQAELDKATAEHTARQNELKEYALAAYVHGDPSLDIEAPIDPTSPVAAMTAGYLQAAAGNRVQLVEAVRTTEENVKTHLAQLDTARQAAATKADDLRHRQDEVEGLVNEQLTIKSQVDADLATLVRKAEDARAAAERAAAQETAKTGTDGGPPAPTTTAPETPTTTPLPPPIPPRPIPPGPPPPPLADAAAKAIAYAKAQLGKPYLWGAAGPDSFDCSGLTMMAWAAGGVKLLHYTGSQYAQTRPIPLSAVQPGDLVFYDNFDHVGLYIGDGKIIHAPHTGSVVQIQDMYFWNTTMAATRPLG